MRGPSLVQWFIHLCVSSFVHWYVHSFVCSSCMHSFFNLDHHHPHNQIPLTISYIERRQADCYTLCKVSNELAYGSNAWLVAFFFSDSHLVNSVQIFLLSLLWLAEEIVIQIWKMFKTRKVTRRRWSGADVVSECLIKYSFQPIVLHPSHILFSMHLLRKSLLNNSLDPIDPRYSS